VLGLAIVVVLALAGCGKSSKESAPVVSSASNGAPLAAAVGAGTSTSRFIDPLTLPTNGTYTVLLDPVQDTVVTNVEARLWTVPADVTGTIATNGAPLAVSTTTPGQAAYVTFTGAASQTVTITYSNVSYQAGSLTSNCCVFTTSVRKPDATLLGGTTTVSASGVTLMKTLPAAGTYTLAIDPNLDAVASVAVSIS
jgi:hypothetical protein